MNLTLRVLRIEHSRKKQQKTKQNKTKNNKAKQKTVNTTTAYILAPFATRKYDLVTMPSSHLNHQVH